MWANGVARTGANEINWRLYGTDLTTSGNATYASIVGTNYNSAPHRPIDVTTGISYATYYHSGVFNSCSATSCGSFNGSTSNSTTCVPSVLGSGLSDIGCMTAAADAFAAGGATNIANAFAWMDNDVRAGTNNGFLIQFTLSDYVNTVYPTWLTIAAGKPIWNYEGGYETQIIPSAGACASVSISSSYCGFGGKLNNLILAYKASANFQTIAFQQMTQMIAGSGAGASPGWYTFWREWDK